MIHGILHRDIHLFSLLPFDLVVCGPALHETRYETMAWRFRGALLHTVSDHLPSVCYVFSVLLIGHVKDHTIETDNLFR